MREQTEPWRGHEASPGPDALQLAPTALVAYLCAHAFLQHGRAGARLLWLHDVHRVIERRGDEVNWPEIVDKSREFGWDASVGEALERCQALFGTSLPKGVLSELRLEVSARSERLVRKKASRDTTRAELVWRDLQCLETGARVRLVLAILFPRPAYLRWRYPRAGWLWPLTYPYRWGVVAREALQSIFRQVAPDRGAPTG